MSVFHNNALIGSGAGTAAAADFQIDRSLRFNDDDSAYLNRTPSSAGNRKTWTWSGWVKRSSTGGRDVLFSSNGGNAAAFDLGFDGSHRLECALGIGPNLVTSAVFRDFSAWMHIVVAVDTTQSTASNRIRIYINGSEIDSFSAANYPAQDHQYDINNTTAHEIGRQSSNYFDGYLTEIHHVDGSQLAASDFGEYDDNNVWQPKAYSGSYGTNGFRLDFSANSSAAALGTDSSGNSNTFTVNNFTVTARDYTSGGSTSGSFYTSAGGAASKMFDGDASTGAFSQTGTATFTFGGSTITASTSLKVRAFKGDSSGANVLVNGTNISSLLNAQSGGGYSTVNITSTLGGAPINLSNVSMVNAGGGSGNIAQIFVDDVELIDASASDIDSLIDTPTNYTADSGNNGGNYCTLNPLASTDGTMSDGNLKIVTNSSGYGVYTSTIGMSSGKWYAEAVATAMTFTHFGLIKSDVNYSSSTIVGNETDTAAYRSNDGVFRLGNSNKFTGTTFSANDVIGLAFDADAGSCAVYKNGSLQGTATGFSSGTWFFAGSDNDGTTTATHVWNFGARPFAYTPPTNHLSLCTQNLPDPTIADGSTAFDIDLFTGTDASLERSNFAFSPDFLWFKSRSATRTHALLDTVRGRAKGLESNTTQAEYTSNSDRDLISFDNDGFTVGQTQQFGSINASGDSIVVWAWDAGTSTASNTDGSITSSVRASQTNGFSVFTYTGTGTAGTAGHGLNAAPEFYILKSRSDGEQWAVYHKSITALKKLVLNSGGAQADTNHFNDTEPTNSVLSIGSTGSVNVSGSTYVGFAWTSISGFSSFGSYIGNGNSSSGTFVYTGFRPRWILVKSATESTRWYIWDTARDTDNRAENRLSPSENTAESTTEFADILSNGFKLRIDYGGVNDTGQTYVYAAFAEHPQKTARAR